MCLGSARGSRAGDGVLAIADFLCNSSSVRLMRLTKACFGAPPKPARETRALPRSERERVFNKDTAFVI